MNRRKQRDYFQFDIFENLFMPSSDCTGITNDVPGVSDVPIVPRQTLLDEILHMGPVFERIGEEELAAACYSEAATGEFTADTLNQIGRLYFDGEFVEEDCPKACVLYEIAYDMGCRDIRCGDYLMMGTYHHHDVQETREYGLYRNIPLAIKWYLKCAENSRIGYSNLGCAYLEHEVRDYQKAFEYLMLSEYTDTRALYYAGIMYEFGLYVEANPLMATMYFQNLIQNHTDKDCYCLWAKTRMKELTGKRSYPLNRATFEQLLDSGEL